MQLSSEAYIFNVNELTFWKDMIWKVIYFETVSL